MVKRTSSQIYHQKSSSTFSRGSRSEPFLLANACASHGSSYSNLQSLPSPISPTQFPDDTETSTFKIFRFEDSHEIERHELHYERVLELKSENTFADSTPRIIKIDASANGLLLFHNSFPKRTDFYICNPITHECLKLPKPEGIPGRGTRVTHGFGVSRLSNQYKVLMIFYDLERDPVTGLRRINPDVVCQVYTLGTGSWRSITAPSEKLIDFSTGKLLNGNLHWLTQDSMRTFWITRFDVETEVFIKSRPPTLELEGHPTQVGVLKDRLCVSQLSSMNEIVIYMMTEDGYEKESWSKEYVISNIQVVYSDSIFTICPLKAFVDGDLLLALDHDCLLWYSNRTRTIAPADMLNEEAEGFPEAILYTPSFISLKHFEIENAKLIEFVCSMS